jgi:hypothetical protein
MRQPGGLLLALLFTGSLTLAGLACAVPARAQEPEEPNIEYFDPVVTRRPENERSVEGTFEYSKGTSGKEVDLAVSLAWPFTSRLQVELEMPLVIQDPKDGPTIGGPGDLAIEPQYIFYKNIDYRLEIAGGFELTLPTGSSSRGLGGELAIEPFLTMGIALGPVDLIADLAYEWVTQPDREQEFSGGVAAGWHVNRRFTPFVELRTVTPTSGGDDHRTQVYVVPGFNFQPIGGLTARLGVQVPLTSAKEFDYRVLGGLEWEF